MPIKHYLSVVFISSIVWVNTQIIYGAMANCTCPNSSYVILRSSNASNFSTWWEKCKSSQEFCSNNDPGQFHDAISGTLAAFKSERIKNKLQDCLDACERQEKSSTTKRLINETEFWIGLGYKCRNRTWYYVTDNTVHSVYRPNEVRSHCNKTSLSTNNDYDLCAYWKKRGSDWETVNGPCTKRLTGAICKCGTIHQSDTRTLSFFQTTTAEFRSTESTKQLSLPKEHTSSQDLQTDLKLFLRKSLATKDHNITTAIETLNQTESKLQYLLERQETVSAINLLKTTRILEKFERQLNAKDEDDITSYSSAFLGVCSQILDELNAESWVRVSSENITRFAANHPMAVVGILERAMAKIRHRHLNTQARDIRIKSDILRNEGGKLSTHAMSEKSSTSNKSKILPQRTGDIELTAVTIWFYKLPALLQAMQKVYAAPPIRQQQFAPSSPALAYNLYNKTGRKVSVPITFTVDVKENINQSSGQRLSCQFYNHTARQWSAFGCSVKKHSLGSVTCSCNHTTTFAVLLVNADLTKLLAQENCHSKSVVNIASYICNSISVFFLLLTLVAFKLAKVPSADMSERHATHTHLAFALLGMNIFSMLAKVAAECGYALCVTDAVITHFMTLSTHAWMTVEGLLLHLHVISKNLGYRTLGRVKHVIGWGVPVIISGITLGVGLGRGEYVYDIKVSTEENTSTQFEQPRYFCWLTSSDKLSWASSGPILIAIAVNVFIFLRVLHTIIRLARERKNYRPSSTNLFTHKTEQCNDEIDEGQSSIPAVVYNAFLKLFPLLGFTWIIGWIPTLLTHQEVSQECNTQGTAAFALALIHVILNGSQGFFIFVVCVLMDRVVKTALGRRLRRVLERRRGRETTTGRKRTATVQSANLS